MFDVRHLAALLISLLVLGEAGLALWRHAPIPVSTAPVFSFPPAAANFGKSLTLAPAIELYGADRGSEPQSLSLLIDAGRFL